VGRGLCRASARGRHRPRAPPCRVLLCAAGAKWRLENDRNTRRLWSGRLAGAARATAISAVAQASRSGRTRLPQCRNECRLLGSPESRNRRWLTPSDCRYVGVWRPTEKERPPSIVPSPQDRALNDIQRATSPSCAAGAVELRSGHFDPRPTRWHAAEKTGMALVSAGLRREQDLAIVLGASFASWAPGDTVRLMSAW
jgi:hypothetical protein